MLLIYQWYFTFRRNQSMTLNHFRNDHFMNYSIKNDKKEKMRKRLQAISVYL